MTVALVGSTVRDVVYLPGRAPARSTGGSPLFAARALAALGVRPGVATRCDDAALAAPIAELAAPLCLRLDSTVVQSDAALPRRRRARPHAGRARRVVERGRHHAAGRRPRCAARRGCTPAPSAAATWGRRCWRRWRAAAAASHSTLRARCGGREIGPIALSGRLDGALLQHVQALKLSEEEALAAFATIDAGAIQAQCGVPEVLVTFGFRGAAVASADGSGHVAAQAVTDIDPTGAGDAFLASYAHARAGGSAPLEAARAACEGVSALFAARARAPRQAPA